jgi:DNA invertase Pin-like site-specific DNA recombinase
MKRIGYCRASTDKQQISIPAQKDKLLAYAKVKGIELDSILRDDATTSRIPLVKREAGSELSQMIDRKEVAGVYIVKLDRAFRNTVECLLTVKKWARLGVELHIIDFGGNSIDSTTATGELLLTFIAGMASWEKAQIGERTKSALNHKKLRKEKTGGDVPYGFDLDTDGIHLVPNMEEQKVIKLAQKLIAQGLTLREVCRKLERGGHSTKRGLKRWHPQTVKTLLNRSKSCVSLT